MSIQYKLIYRNGDKCATMRGDRLAQNFEKLRRLLSSQLADMVGLGAQQIYRYENGKTEPDGEIVAELRECWK